MAKEEKEDKKPADPRQARWDGWVENYKKQSPEKYAARRATTYVDDHTGEVKSKKDELANIPADFQ